MSRSPRAARLLALAGSLVLSACAHSTTASNEPAAMSPSAVPHAPDAPTLLKSLLGLIRDTHRVQDITPERLRAHMGQGLEPWGPTRFGFRGDLTPQWRYIGDVDVGRRLAPGMEFAFVPTEPGGNPDTADICGFGFHAFDRALREAGFDTAPHFGEHGQVLWHDYMRDGLRVQVMFRGAATARTTAADACVTSVVLR